MIYKSYLDKDMKMSKPENASYIKVTFCDPLGVPEKTDFIIIEKDKKKQEK